MTTRLDRLYADGILDGPHLDTANEIVAIRAVFHRSLFAARNPYQPRLGNRHHVGQLDWHFHGFSPGLLGTYHRRYLPWARAMSVTPTRALVGPKARSSDKKTLAFVWDVLQSSQPLTALPTKYRLRTPYGSRQAKKALRETLDAYVTLFNILEAA